MAVKKAAKKPVKKAKKGAKKAVKKGAAYKKIPSLRPLRLRGENPDLD